MDSAETPFADELTYMHVSVADSQSDESRRGMEEQLPAATAFIGE
jgi:hypothetical protein